MNGIEHNKKRPYITMSNNQRVHVLEIPKSEVHPKEIALHLAKNCRFNGLINGWYSTAEHCLLGLRKVSNSETARQFLIHDAGEVITGDFPAPIKWLYPELRNICDKIQGKYNVHFIGKAELDPEIHEIDYRLCATEQKYMRNAPEEELIAAPYDDIVFPQWDWQTAYEKWLTVFYDLFPEWKE